MKKIPNAILLSDIHLREDNPICWVGDFQKEQWNTMDFICDLQEKYNIPVLIAGDIFHTWKASPWLLSMAMQHFPKQCFCIAGQHDLPQHNMQLINKSGLYTLAKAKTIKILNGCHFGQTPVEASLIIKKKSILVWHNFTYVGKEPFPGCNSPRAHVLLEKYKQFDLILTGDNHQSFTSHGLSGNLLVNPGSLMRQTAAQIDFQPKVYLWYVEDNIVETVDVPIEQGVITREHIEKVQERDERIDAFISSLKTGWEMSLSFEDNMKMFFETNRVRKDIKDIIYEAMEEEK